MSEIIVYASQDQNYTFWSDRLMPWLITLGLIAIALVIGYANWQNSKPFRIESSTSMDPKAALDSLQSSLALNGWALGFRDDTTLIMSSDHNARFGSTAVIGCISVWLGLLHVLTSRRRITVQFMVTASATGSSILTSGSRSGGGALPYIAAELRELPKS